MSNDTQRQEDVAVSLALMEKATTDSAEQQKLLTSQLTELVITMKESNIKYDLMLGSSLEKAAKNELAITSHIEFAKPILSRVKKKQDNFDKMITGLFSKAGFAIVTILIALLGILFGFDPSTLKFK
jgi:DUF1009 family protein